MTLTVNQHFAGRNSKGFLFLKEMKGCLTIMAVSGKRNEIVF